MAALFLGTLNLEAALLVAFMKSALTDTANFRFGDDIDNAGDWTSPSSSSCHQDLLGSWSN